VHPKRLKSFGHKQAAAEKTLLPVGQAVSLQPVDRDRYSQTVAIVFNAKSPSKMIEKTLNGNSYGNREAVSELKLDSARFTVSGLTRILLA